MASLSQLFLDFELVGFFAQSAHLVLISVALSHANEFQPAAGRNCLCMTQGLTLTRTYPKLWDQCRQISKKDDSSRLFFVGVKGSLSFSIYVMVFFLKDKFSVCSLG